MERPPSDGKGGHHNLSGLPRNRFRETRDEALFHKNGRLSRARTTLASVRVVAEFKTAATAFSTQKTGTSRGSMPHNEKHRTGLPIS